MSVVKTIKLSSLVLSMTMLGFATSPVSSSEVVENSSITNKSASSKCSYNKSTVEKDVESILLAQNVVSDICYRLFVRCKEENPPWVPCGDCLTICNNNDNEWPFWKCRIPGR